MSDTWNHPDSFANRHIGPSEADLAHMSTVCGQPSADALIDEVVPADIRFDRPLLVPEAAAEAGALAELEAIAAENQVCHSYLGMGYHDCVVPPLSNENVLENPGWYTQYTPYQAEIAQGRMEGLLAFQTMISDLTGLPVANASLLDEATAAAEAMSMAAGIVTGDRSVVFVDHQCHPQTIEVLRTRAQPLEIEILVGDHKTYEPTTDLIAIVLQYPATDGALHDYSGLCDQVHAAGAQVIAACDLMACAVFTPPGEWGADIAIGGAQRLGVPMIWRSTCSLLGDERA